jgi:hypothetical protein
MHRRSAFAMRIDHRHISQVGQDFGTTIGREPRGQQLRAPIDERRGHMPSLEVRMVERRGQERDIRRHAPDTELRHRPARGRR